MKKGYSCVQETECQQEDKVEVIRRLESKTSKSGYETKSTFKAKEQWKGVDSFDSDENKKTVYCWFSLRRTNVFVLIKVKKCVF